MSVYLLECIERPYVAVLNKGFQVMVGGHMELLQGCHMLLELAPVVGHIILALLCTKKWM